MSHNRHRSKDDDDDNLSLAELMSLRISEEKMYQQQLQSSFYQLQYLHQQQMLSMKSRRSSTSTSSSSSRHRYHHPLTPSSSNFSVKQSYRQFDAKPAPTNNEPIKRRQSLGKRIKKAFGMTELSDTLPKPSASLKKKEKKIPEYSPASSTISTISTNTSSASKKSLSFNPVIQLHETFSASEYDRRCDTDTTCQKLTPVLALQIKEELNQFKLNDMLVHLDSRQYTHFFM